MVRWSSLSSEWIEPGQIVSKYVSLINVLRTSWTCSRTRFSFNICSPNCCICSHWSQLQFNHLECSLGCICKNQSLKIIWIYPVNFISTCSSEWTLQLGKEPETSWQPHLSRDFIARQNGGCSNKIINFKVWIVLNVFRTTDICFDRFTLKLWLWRTAHFLKLWCHLYWRIDDTQLGS